MTPEEFINIWKDNELTERAGAQAHFDDLCDLLGVDKPRDPKNYCFERGAKKSDGGDGWADVWKRGFFGWENKKPGRNLDAALKQLTDYALKLENPPLLVVSDRERIIIHTAFTGYPDEPREIRIGELIDPEKRQILRWVFTDPQKLRPEKSTAAITAAAAGHFAALAKAMRERGLNGQIVAHFLVQCLFCMFAEDEDLLPGNVFTEILKNAGGDADKAGKRIGKLFAAMQQTGGEYGDHDIAWFNGGLFKTIDIPPLTADDIAALLHAADTDWRSVDPTIFGTLFERGLDPAARAPLGAHYTDTGTIAKLIQPLITDPLLDKWQSVKAVIAAGQDKSRRTNDYKDSRDAYQNYLSGLQRFQVLDPACGSGNFLYLALKALRGVEKQVHLEAQELGFEPELLMQTGPHNIRGMEINEYAAELARVTVWIGDIQWCRRNGREIARDPILRPLDGIEHRDALLNPDGSEAAWPDADVIIGNPPFLGGNKKRGELGDDYVNALNYLYAAYVPGGADLVCYWFYKARQQIITRKLTMAGLVATQAIRSGSNRKVLDDIVTETKIFNAWSDETWVNEGAAVRVSLVCFGESEAVAKLDGHPVATINADLTEGGEDRTDLTRAKVLPENMAVAFKGAEKSGAFEIPGELARIWLTVPNPNGYPNSDVVKPWANGQDIAKRPSNTWIIDFGIDMPVDRASLYELPFEHILKHVKSERDRNNDRGRRENWWRFGRNGADMRAACEGLPRLIITPRVAKHRYFVWLHALTSPDSRLCVIARADDTAFGILSSRLHEVWSLATASMHGVGNDPTYNTKSCFETFPFPDHLTPRDTAFSGPCASDAQADSAAKAIADAAVKLNHLRENWLNPPEWVDWVITPEEEKAGFPKRPVAKPGYEADLKKRTLTNLYNARPHWLDMAHKALDKTVAAAYGWTDYTPELPDSEILLRLLALNQERSKAAEVAEKT
ncbi:MAG: class I SAM-dependent DNA methyltransferase [Alphaproteobacteria bacterium]|nr:class I SAM-dependent DNA methyltransferase [Alphaproteobacteria bacterium]MDD4092440.1 N-6 DNA methylase [Smithellaceae bacterium]